MHQINITHVLDILIPLDKFDDKGIHGMILSDNAAVKSINSGIGIIFICREDLKQYKNDSWEKNGITYHSILLPHDEVLHASVEEVTRLCARLTVERLVAWEETKRKKAARKMRRMARTAAEQVAGLS